MSESITDPSATPAQLGSSGSTRLPSSPLPASACADFDQGKGDGLADA